jgi:general secretion pathway protein G
VEISKLIQALDSFYASMDRYPTNEEGLAVLAEKSDAFPAGLVQAVPNDPWSNAYEYRSPGASDPYEILCFGADKRQGGEGADRDITSMDLLRAKKNP